MQSIDLREFYSSFCGMIVQRTLRALLRDIWPDARGGRVLGVGYATPYLKPFFDESTPVVALTHESEGGVYWPQEGEGLVALYGDAGFPIETNSISRIVAIHAADDAAGMNALLAECWRVLEGQGRLILVVPNRTGLWARADSTPFGHGAPWSVRQMKAVLRAHMFVPERIERALFVPPVSARLVLATAAMWEKLGRRFFNAFGGVNVIEVSKQIYATIPPSARAVNRHADPAQKIRLADITKITKG